MPAVGRIAAAGGGRIVDFEVAAKDAIGAFRACLAPVLHQSAGTVLRTGGERDQAALGVLGTAGDDVDDPVDGVRAPHCSAGSTNHLDALNILEGDILLVPIGP